MAGVFLGALIWGLGLFNNFMLLSMSFFLAIWLAGNFGLNRTLGFASADIGFLCLFWSDTGTGLSCSGFTLGSKCFCAPCTGGNATPSACDLLLVAISSLFAWCKVAFLIVFSIEKEFKEMGITSPGFPLSTSILDKKSDFHVFSLYKIKVKCIS